MPINLSSQTPRPTAKARDVSVKYIDPYSAGVVPMRIVIPVVTMTPKAIDMIASIILFTSIFASLHFVRASVAGTGFPIAKGVSNRNGNCSKPGCVVPWFQLSRPGLLHSRAIYTWHTSARHLRKSYFVIAQFLRRMRVRSVDRQRNWVFDVYKARQIVNILPISRQKTRFLSFVHKGDGHTLRQFAVTKIEFSNLVQ